ncbi:metal-dependent hydrolase [Bacillus aerolatus]|uniref:Metal-dependent hydrolase n=1 Tax=Bacillus aerolatus TaxID=2653354 RepID=A0A6I1FG53_9BACI|nr:metal-dependent hydrolase [Bacillus aerolatus]KAB7707110.1 metal-dependent hydrolase [Bacillus aerolatus]
MKILRIGHAMYVLTSQQGKRYLVDPFFDMNPGCPPKYQTKEYLQTIDGVFLTHGHFDHVSGLKKLRDSNPDCLIIAQYELAMILMQQGFQHVYPLNLGGSFAYEDMTATMVQARHSSSYGETEGTPIYAGESAGYIFDFHDDETVYHSGDTNVMLDMKLFQDIYRPSIAILSSSGQFTMGPKEAAYAVKHLLDVDYVIPSHTFPTRETASNPETLDALLVSFPVVGEMIGKDEELKKELEGQSKTKVIILGYGDEAAF